MGNTHTHRPKVGFLGMGTIQVKDPGREPQPVNATGGANKFAALEGALLRNVRDEGRCLVCRTAVIAGARSKSLGVVHIL